MLRQIKIIAIATAAASLPPASSATIGTVTVAGATITATMATTMRHDARLAAVAATATMTASRVTSRMAGWLTSQ